MRQGNKHLASHLLTLNWYNSKKAAICPAKLSRAQCTAVQFLVYNMATWRHFYFIIDNFWGTEKICLIYATVCQGVTHYICSANKLYFSCRMWMLTRKSPFSCKARICVFKLCRTVLNSVFKPISGVYSMHIWYLHKIS